MFDPAAYVAEMEKVGLAVAVMDLPAGLSAGSGLRRRLRLR